MASREPRDQLFDLCVGEGATANKIQDQAPFMEQLPATQHAMEVLPASVSRFGWGGAARALLICAVRPNGAAGLNELHSNFAVACLALDGSTYSMTQRLNNLVHGGTGVYPTSKNTLIKMRALVMKNLAVTLQMLDKYPCATADALRSVALQAADHIQVMISHQLPNLEDHNRLDLYRQILDELTKATAFFRNQRELHTLRERFEIMVRAIAGGTYSRFFEEVAPRGIDKLVIPELVPDLYEGTKNIYDPRSPEAQLTAHIMAWVIRDTEEHDLWRDTLVMPRNAETADQLASQRQRLRRYFDTLSYSY